MTPEPSKLQWSYTVHSQYPNPDDTISALSARVAELEGALRWYADENNYDENGAPIIVSNIGHWYDRGGKAREVLK